MQQPDHVDVAVYLLVEPRWKHGAGFTEAQALTVVGQLIAAGSQS